MWYHFGKYCECSLGVHVVDELSHNGKSGTITLTHVINMNLNGFQTVAPLPSETYVNSFMTSPIRFINVLHFKTHAQHDAWFIDNMHMVYF